MYHTRYHLSMVHEIENEFDAAEQDTLVRVIAKLNKFFEKTVGAAT